MAAILYKWLMIASGIFATLPAGADYVHPFYISVTELNYNQTSKSIEISCKLFADDLEKALAKAYGGKPDLFTPKDKSLADKEVGGYIRDHLVIRMDGKPVPLEFVGFERENDGLWSYLQSAALPVPKLVEIRNSLLYDSFDQQINLIHVTVKGERKSTRLDYPQTNARFEFNAP